MIIIIIIILYSNKLIRGGSTKSHIINYMDYLHLKQKKKKYADYTKYCSKTTTETPKQGLKSTCSQQSSLQTTK